MKALPFDRHPTVVPATWLVIGGPLSEYTFDLFGVIADRWPITFHILHDPLKPTGQFAHERFESDRFRAARWRGAPVADIASFIESARADVVLLYGTTPKREALIAAWKTESKVPFVFVSDTNVLELSKSRSWTRGFAYRLLFTRVNAALSLGLTNEAALRVLGARQILNVPCYSVDYDLLCSTGEPSPPRLEDDRLTLLFIGRLVAVKNIAAVVDAIAGDAVLRRRMRLVLIGDGPDRDALEKRCRDAALDVEFLGALPRRTIGQHLTRSDALVLPSTSEPWGIVVTEALGAGVPVVATPNVGSAVSLAGVTQAVLLSAGHSVEHLRHALQEYLQRHRLLRDAARRTAPSVRALYGRSEVAEAMVHEIGALCAQMRS